MSFSERMGLVQPRTVVQKDAIDGPLRARFWDIVRIFYLADSDEPGEVTYSPRSAAYRSIWMHFFELPGDEVPLYVGPANQTLKVLVMKEAWNRVYDFVEFVLTSCDTPASKADVVQTLNAVLDQHMSAYRFINDEFVPVTDEMQIVEIEKALASPLTGVRRHLSKSLGHLSDRDTPDIENSIKESVSAVESICSAIIGEKSTLGEALKKLKANGLVLHPALEKAWIAAYGYASDENGIRHAMQEDSSLKVADALYFVVTCSAFVTLLTQHAADLGIELRPVA